MIMGCNQNLERVSSEGLANSLHCTCSYKISAKLSAFYLFIYRIVLEDMSMSVLLSVIMFPGYFIYVIMSTFSHALRDRFYARRSVELYIVLTFFGEFSNNSNF